MASVSPLLAGKDSEITSVGSIESLSSLSSSGGEDKQLRDGDLRLASLLDELQRRAGARTKESLDYDTAYDQRRRSSWGFERRCWGYSGVTCAQWVLTMVLSVTVGVIAFVMSTAIEELQLRKIKAVEQLLNPCTVSPTACEGFDDAQQRAQLRPMLALGVFCATNAGLAVLAAGLTVYFAPEAAGSGIPEVMGYLNGVHIPRILRLRTLTVKVISSILVVCSGLALGVLGPLVHCGAIIGSGLTRGQKVWRGCGGRRICVTRVWRMMERLQNDADRRDFISTGAAVGFAAAFGAPVGGVLFALEETASSWDSKLMWRTLTATTSACFVLAISERYAKPSVLGPRLECGDGLNDTALELFQPGLLTFQAAATFGYPWENFACIVLGMAGGLLGALFNRSHAAISRFRKRWLRKPSMQVLEVACLSLLTSSIVFTLSLYGSCRDVNVRGVLTTCNTADEPFRLQWATANGVPSCDSTEYNDMATALLVGQRRVIVSMMEGLERYSVLTQLAAGCSFFVLMTITYGSAVPAGVFVPTIVAGSCFGSLFGSGMETLFREYGVSVFGTGNLVTAAPYTLQGAVALLGGVQRSSLSLVVIILEGTGAVQQLLPIILTTVVAKWSGDLLNKGGLYSVALELKRIPFLEDGQRRSNQSKIVRDVMTRHRAGSRGGDGVICFNEVETNVTEVLAKLADNSHNGFPVVRQMADGRRHFCGLVLRNQVLTLIAMQHLKFDGAETVHVDSNQSVDVDTTGPKERVGFDTTSEFAEEFLRRSGAVTGGVSTPDGKLRGPHRSAVPRLIEALAPTSTRKAGASRAFAMMSLDLAQIMQKSPFTIDELCPLPRVWRLFRSMGLRHLVVLDQEHCVVGIITRADLLAASNVDI